MAAPTFVQAGTAVAVTGASATVDIPTARTVAGDIIIRQGGKCGTGAVPTLTSVTNIEDLDGSATPTLLANEQAVGGTGQGEHNIWIGRIIATNTATSIVYNGPAADILIRLYQFTGAHAGTTLGDVVENDAADFSNGTPLTQAQINDTGVVTNGADRLALQFVFVIDDNAVDSFAGETGGDWVWAVAEATTTTTNPDSCLQLQTATIASAGTIDGGSYTMAASDSWGVIGFALIPAAGGTTTNQALTATVATTATMVRSTGKLVSACVATSASMVRSVGKIVSASAATTATLVRQIGKTLTASVGTTATLEALRVFIVNLTATVGTTASMVRQVGKTLTASTVATSASITKQVSKTLSASVATVASLTAIKVFIVLLTATVGTTASMSRQVGKVVSASVATSRSIAKSLATTLSTTVGTTATITKQVGKTLSATVATLASLIATFSGVAAPVTGRFDRPSPEGGYDQGSPEGGFDQGTPEGGYD